MIYVYHSIHGCYLPHRRYNHVVNYRLLVQSNRNIPVRQQPKQWQRHRTVIKDPWIIQIACYQNFHPSQLMPTLYQQSSIADPEVSHQEDTNGIHLLDYGYQLMIRCTIMDISATVSKTRNRMIGRQARNRILVPRKIVPPKSMLST